MADRYQIKVMKAIPGTNTRYEVLLTADFESGADAQEIVENVREAYREEDITSERGKLAR
jgi:hypothetical protein